MRAVMGWYGGGAGWLMMIANVVLSGSLIAAATWAVIRLAPGGGPGPGHHDRVDAREVLDRRFAAGEIDAQEYQQAVRLLAMERAG
ncbi:SHOCT domain-containing protein [Thalassiella azotivora]